jgi:hypothetical protein
MVALADHQPTDFAQPPDPQPAPPRTAPKPAPALGADELVPGTTALSPIQAGSLTLIPLVVAKPPDSPDDLLVLDEAMQQRLVRIHEVDDAGEVNELTLTNKSRRPLFLLAGEVIIGGKQDRIIGKNTIIPARTTLDVPVFCVEHGRWSDGTSKEFRSANALAHGKLRAKASFEDQSQVWSEVAAKNDARKTTNATDTYRTVATQQVDGTLAADEKQVRAALAKLPKGARERMVGYAVAINGSVATVDVFGSPQLFRKLEDKLMRSYLTEAVDVVADAKAVAPTVAAVKEFMADADAADEEASYATTAADTAIKGGKRAAKAMVTYKPKAVDTGAAGAAPAAEAPAVFQNYSVK